VQQGLDVWMDEENLQLSFLFLITCIPIIFFSVGSIRSPAFWDDTCCVACDSIS